ncbi:hypothetical protein PENVUL_c007G04006 [Penicillium vulpinum]|uniref:Uncharacterized protein n=1 Tax=Penicillium vulpinum TaxID=29845 RepID=A0A1V6S633_9EURO|nr:hypothetical protein PENVUL_c007G04006 [Penicillium vulpinum]
MGVPSRLKLSLTNPTKRYPNRVDGRSQTGNGYYGRIRRLLKVAKKLEANHELTIRHVWLEAHWFRDRLLRLEEEVMKYPESRARMEAWSPVPDVSELPPYIDISNTIHLSCEKD